MSGSLEQTVVPGGSFESVTFKNVQTFNRESYNCYFLSFNQTGSEIVVPSTTIPTHFEVGSVLTETLTLNGQKYEIKLNVTAAGSSSSTTENSSSSEAEVNSSSSEEHTTFVQAYAVNPLKVSVAGRMLQITGADVVQVEVFDMQGSPVASFRQVAGSVSLEKLRQGNYIVRVRSGSMSLTRRVSIK